MLDISHEHRWKKNYITGRVECQECEAFYDIELAKKCGVPDMGSCKMRITRKVNLPKGDRNGKGTSDTV